jgi:predicted site-specific integrase-resolvase
MNVHLNQSTDILSKAQAASLLGVSERTLTRWHAEGSGPPVIKQGRKSYYFRQSVLGWLKAKEREGVRG